MLAMLQTILAAPNNRRDSPWMQLLVIVVIAVIYGVKMLSKAKNPFKEEEEGEQQQGGRMSELAKAATLARADHPQEPAPTLLDIETEPEPEPEPVAKKTLTPPPRQSRPTKPKPQISPALSLDFNDTNSLRRAIIYSEILGKPVALRQGDQGFF